MIKKIGIVSIYPKKQKYYIPKSGVAPYTRSLVNALLKLTTNIKIILFADSENLINDELDSNVLNIKRIWKEGFFFYSNIYKFIKKENLSIVHIQHEFRLFGNTYTVLSFLYLLYKLKLSNIKTIVTLHCIIDKSIIRKDFLKENNINISPIFFKLALIFFYKIVGILVSHIIIHEFKHQRILQNIYNIKKNKTTVVPIGVEKKNSYICKKDAKKYLKIKKNKVVLFFGFVTAYKSLDLLIDAFINYSKVDKDCLLIIAGGKHPRFIMDKRYNEEYEKLKELSKKIGKEQIWWKGFLQTQEIKKFISASDLLVLPYKEALGSSHPLSIALGYKKPFIASKLLIDGPQISNFTFNNNKEDIVNKISYFFNNGRRFPSFLLSEREKRSWTNIAEKTIEIYKNINNGVNSNENSSGLPEILASSGWSREMCS